MGVTLGPLLTWQGPLSAKGTGLPIPIDTLLSNR